MNDRTIDQRILTALAWFDRRTFRTTISG